MRAFTRTTYCLALAVGAASVGSCSQADRGQPSAKANTASPVSHAVTSTDYTNWGFSLQRPIEWSAYQYGFNGSLFDVIGYLSTDKLSDPCTRTANSTSCGGAGGGILVAHLSTGGVVVTVGNAGSPGVRSIEAFAGKPSTVGGQPARVQDPADLTDDCQRMGGTRQIAATIARPHAGANFLSLNVCLAAPTIDTEKATLQLINSVRFQTQ